jgi:1,4-dihydroxy-2-naphthoyl-CoA synthase
MGSVGKYEKLFRGRPVEDFDFDEILYDKKEFVAVITLNRLKQFNAYNGTELFEICEALHDVAVADKIAVAVITGAVDRTHRIRLRKDQIDRFGSFYKT